MNVLRGRIEWRRDGPHFIEHDPASTGSPSAHRLDLALRGTSLETVAARAPAPEVMLGVRPEHIACAAESNAASLSGQIELSEPMGAETHVHARTAHHTLIARVSADERFAPGETTAFCLDGSRLHLFDAETERALRA